MNEKKIDISKKVFEKLVAMANGKGYNFNAPESDYIGSITQGAVSLDLTLIKDKSFSGEDYCYDSRYAIDAQYYLLGKDTGYAETDNGIPYDNVTGFYSKSLITKSVPGTFGAFKECSMTYEQFIKNLSDEFDKYLNEELIEGTRNTEFIWNKNT